MEYRICTRCDGLGSSSASVCGRCGGALRLGDESEYVGHQFGSYQLTAVLGVGGMGVVYRARHVRLDKPAAVKLVPPDGGTGEFEQRFRREAQLLATLKHPGVVEIYDFDVTATGIPWYVMELLEGASLAELRQRLGALTQAYIGSILAELGEALTHAHDHGVVHRDLKPANVFLARQSSKRAKLKLLDFGIAKRIDALAVSGTQLTGTGTVIGTPMYLAPEQVDARPVSAATDQYALALIVAELLIGEPWRQGLSISQIVLEEIPYPLDEARLPDGLDASLRAALVRATQPRPGDRFASIADFVAACALPATGELTCLLEEFEQPTATVRLTPGSPLMAAAQDSARARRPTVEPRSEREPGQSSRSDSHVAAATMAAPEAIVAATPVARSRRTWMRWSLPAAVLVIAVTTVIWWRLAATADDDRRRPPTTICSPAARRSQ